MNGRGSEGSTAQPETRRVLVVAAEAAVGEHLLDPLGDHLAPSSEIFITAPALTGGALKHAMGDVDDARDAAEERLRDSIERLEEEGLAIGGQIGDSDPVLAIQDALAVFPADEIVLVTRPEEEARWLEGDLFDRAKREFEQEITHISIDREGEGDADVTDVEHAGEGVEPPPDAEVSPRSRNLPKLSARDVGGIIVALVGTLVLVVLAATCGNEEGLQRQLGSEGVGSDGGCVARNIIAGAAALANIAHVVGLVLFESVGYRGGWARMFGLLSLVGTPLAIIASLLVH